MGKRAPAPPTPPDPVATAEAQGRMNVQTAETQARLNRVNQVGPQGSLTFTAPTRFNEEAYLAANLDVVGSGMTGQEHFDRHGFAENRPGVMPGYSTDAPWTATTTFSPEQQRLYDLSTGAQEAYGGAALNQLQAVEGRLSTPFQFGGAPDFVGGVADRSGDLVNRTGDLQFDARDRTGDVMRRADFTGIGDPNQSRDAVEAALLARINPQLERERAALETRLANQGITQGSEAFQTGMGDYGRLANDARFGAILNAGQEQSRMFGLGFGQTDLNNRAVGQQMDNDLARGSFRNSAVGQAAQMDLARTGLLSQMDLARAGFGNAARQQSLQEQLALRAQPVNEASALLTGQQVGMPQFQPVPQVGLQAPDYQGAVAQNFAGQMAGYNARMQQIGAQNAALGQAIGTAGQAAIMISDRRLKRDVQRIGTGAYDLPVYRWTYLWGEEGVGHMADDVERVRPDAVIYDADGFAMVNYGALA